MVAPHATFPDEGSGQQVSTRGEYTGDPLVVVNRRFDDAKVSWVLDRFVVDGTGANLVVVRGWIPAGEDPLRPLTEPWTSSARWHHRSHLTSRVAPQTVS
uniref:SURF1 family protein n=1 Tax=Janibacter limosus TaxID=53458 RepID=A0AC61U258_9MICO|nr:SURF1 family protein [Janibacter limosus]